MTDFWPWLSLAGLGAFHGVNPAMGWLFAVALGLHRQSSRIVWLSLLPIAAGHAVAIAVVLAAFMAFGTVVDLRSLKLFAAALILGLAGYYAFYGHRHRVRVGMRTGMAGLALWSFLMATGHGAGLMLVPAVLGLCLADPSATIRLGSSLPISLAAVALHTAATLAVTAAVAFAIIEWFDLGVLRTAWINFDLIWTLALVATGVILVVA
ncbi:MULTISPECIES: hypothetical protein [unclassified Sinorhizobium]|uniref:hypothetical protein n=1 Tax=unclassified Sinorhizobium TaxID=2613772 RepID=UPI0024C38B86|nr:MULTISPECIES: hypothetical protein [unclassified Sinorhizobium]MDK1374343.1 hypothetical protein [Sinorhizobium sp. 6-70]MDK1482238.1 hypothetical protein [Sinorhizobium sp. 6-117]